MLLLASRLPPLPSRFLRASSAASCPLGHAMESVDLARAGGAFAVLKCALYELVRRPSAWASPRTTSAAREDRMAGGLAALARCMTLDALQPEADSAAEGLCAACVALCCAVWAGKHEKVWDNLAVWFGLDAMRAGV
ncbi:hypothetical protein FB451DRAFT_1404392 [Mycena latifolia]|nr:hypothetical protein FB451DRAFT_1404392 [Mycena latifolia]